MSDDLIPTTSETFARIRAVLVEARRTALSAVNAAMVQAYWNVGREIVEEEQRGNQRADYGARLLEILAAHLTAEFGKGFDVSNLRYMRLFYLAFPIRDALRPELCWTHYRLLCRVTPGGTAVLSDRSHCILLVYPRTGTTDPVEVDRPNLVR